MANLPDKVIRQRLKLQMQSLDSPSELTGAFRPSCDIGVSPMTDLALNFHSSSLGMTPSPNMDTKRRLCLDSSSSDSTPSPGLMESSGVSNDSPAPMIRVDSTPLSSITNKPNRTKLGFASRLTSLKTSLRDTSPSNKENILPLCSPLFSPAKRLGKVLQSPSFSCKSSPAKDSSVPGRRSKSLHCLGDPGRRRSVKRPVFSMLEEDSRDSGYNSQTLHCSQEDMHTYKKARGEDEPAESLEQMLADCSPGKEEGFAALPDSPEAKITMVEEDDDEDEDEEEDAVVVEEEDEDDRDGFNILSLETISEENEAPGLLNRVSLLNNRILLPSQLEGRPAFMAPPWDCPSDLQLLSTAGSLRPTIHHRPQFRRALSMMEPSLLPSNNSSSPLSRAGNFGHLGKLGFKRPEPPREGPSLLGVKKRRMGETIAPNCSGLGEGHLGRKKPVFCRSHSETELSIMKSCQLKEETPDILPDSSRLYALPSISVGSKHPSLRSITCHTLSEVMDGRYASTIRSYRVVDVRYKFEFDGGHIGGAENWQHGEDEEFLSAFLPTVPLPKAPLSYDSDTHDEAASDRRDILIFHCEFSSQRGPDFYMKLRDRDRQLNNDVYPGLHFPECYLLHLGYKEFWRNYPSLCTGTYTEMIDPRHESDLRKMRAKSKSWSGGTVARTSRLGRLNL